MLRDGDSDFLIGVNLNRSGNLQMLGNPQRQYLKAGKWKNIDVIERFNEAEVLDAFSGKTKQASREYFYCHAAVDGNSQASFNKSYAADAYERSRSSSCCSWRRICK